MSERTVLKYTGSTPGADTNDYTLLDTITAFGRGVLPVLGVQRVMLNLQCAALGTLKAYRQRNEDTAYVLYATEAIAAATSGSGTVVVRDWDVTPYANWKLVWTNGNSSQSALWTPELVATTTRHAAV